MSERISQVTVTTGDRPLSAGLRRDAELVAQMADDVAAGLLSPQQIAGSIRQLAQRLESRAGAAEAIEDAAKHAAGEAV